MNINNSTKAEIALYGSGLVFLIDDFFPFLSKGWANVMLAIAGTGFFYLAVKSATSEALKEHDLNK